ncbi:MAG: sialate O-acetylesterase, partial [Planctomycetaceae bacterium]
CIIKTTLGTPALANELRPPGSGQTGSSYTRLVQQVRASLGSLQDKFPDYTDEAGYEIAGLILNLGEQDQDPDLYAHYLPILIADLRKDLQVQELPVVIVGTGRGGRIQPDFPRILSAQRAVAALPQFAATVTWVDTRGFWPSEDARDASRHPSHERWYDNAESFYRMGNAAAQGLLKLLH